MKYTIKPLVFVSVGDGFGYPRWEAKTVQEPWLTASVYLNTSGTYSWNWQNERGFCNTPEEAMRMANESYQKWLIGVALEEAPS